MKCLVCKSSNTVPKQKLRDDRYGYPGLFELTMCRNCGHAFLKSNFSSNQLTQLYSNYYPRSVFSLEKYHAHEEKKGFISWFDGSRSSAHSWVPRNVRILDIGCGFGESLGYHKARGCDVYGVEADKNILRVADKYGFKVHTGLFNPNIYEPDFFDYVTMNQVIEHVTDPLKTLHGVANILKTGGKTVITTPNAQGWGAKVFANLWINWHAPYHLQFFSKKSMQIAAKKNGFHVIKTLTITSSEWLNYQWMHLITYPNLGKPSAFWSNHKKPNVYEKILLIFFTLFHKSKINHFLTRFLDTIEIGDNFLFILEKQ